MDTQQILDALRDEKSRLEHAISALEGSGTGARRGRKPGPVPGTRRGRRRLSAAAKKRISFMMKKRWAERKKAAKAA